MRQRAWSLAPIIGDGVALVAIGLAGPSVETAQRAAQESVQYEVMVDDPDTFSAPWTVSFPLTLDLTYPMFEYACHEGNNALPNVLRGMRADEAGPVRR